MLPRKLDHEYIRELENMLLQGDSHFRCVECEYVHYYDERDLELQELDIECCDDCADRVKRRLADEADSENFITYLYETRK